MVQAAGRTSDMNTRPSPLDVLYSSSDESDDPNPGVHQVRITDKGSQSHCAHVQIQGVPVCGIIDSGADITIIGGSLFKRVATVARLRQRDFKAADKTPRTYDQRPFTLDGRMDLDISFGDKAMHTTVYVKMDAHVQLLLSEGVCRQLGILSYHPEVEKWQGGRKKATRGQTTLTAAQTESATDPQTEAKVPTVHVKLVQAVKLDPRRSTMVKVRLTPHDTRTLGRRRLLSLPKDSLNFESCHSA